MYIKVILGGILIIAIMGLIVKKILDHCTEENKTEVDDGK